MTIDFIRCLKLKEDGLSKTEIAGSIQISRPTLSKVMTFLETENISLEQAKVLGNDKLKEMYCGANPRKETDNFAKPDFQHVHHELKKKGVTLELLHDEYCKQYAASSGSLQLYGYSRFCQLYEIWRGENRKLTMPKGHLPGDSMEVDWIGLKPHYKDPETGSIMDAHVLVAVLPYSLNFYYEVFDDEKMPAWLQGHVHAFEYFEGVPRIVIPDNLKTGVVKHKRLEIIYHPAYVELLDYYDTAPVAARNKHPKDKPNGENCVKIIERKMMAPLRNETFIGLNALKEAMKEKYEEVIAETTSTLGCSRKEYYEAEEKEFMKPLPKEPFKQVEWARHKVGLDYLILADSNRYSVPHAYVGKHVDIRITDDKVQVYSELKLICEHERIHEKRRFPIVNVEHMPRNHQEYLQYNREGFMKFARSVGPETENVFTALMDSAKVPEQVYPHCASLKHLSEKYGKDLLEQACAAVNHAGSPTDVKKIDLYVKNPEKIPVIPQSRSEMEMVNRSSRGITRGMDAFGGDNRSKK